MVTAKKDPTLHAEIVAIRDACKKRKDFSLKGCTLYTSCEPCPMCLGAIQSFRIKKVVYGASDHRLGACGSWVNLVAAQHPFHNVEIEGGILEEESSILLKRFFQMRRREQLEDPIIDRGSILNETT
jgi:tRNA(adenine34) deaminase